MALKYAIGPAVDLQAIADAFDFANDLIDADGNRTPKPAQIIIAGQDVTGDPRFDPNAQGNGIVVGTFSAVGALTTDPADPDGDSCLALDDESPAVAPYLGTTLGGVAIPDASELVTGDQLPPNLNAILHPPPFVLPPPADPEPDPEPDPTCHPPKHKPHKRHHGHRDK